MPETEVPVAAPKRRWIGPFLKKRQCTVPTWRACLLGAALLLITCVIVVRNLYPFLAVNAPITAGALVVEGWTSDRTLQAASDEFQRGQYTKLYVVGGPIDRGAALSSYGNYAALGAAIVEAAGVPGDKIQAVPSPAVRQDRTYTEGRALSRWFETKGDAPKQLHLFTEGAHARRSRLLFQMALGDKIKVGITAVPPLGYDGDRWWRSSAGFRNVTSELLAYVYARVLFRP